jgi:hypothetical protein
MVDEKKTSSGDRPGSDVNVDPLAAKHGDLIDHARKAAEEEARRGRDLEQGTLRSTHEDRSFSDKLRDVIAIGLHTEATASSFSLSRAFAFSLQGIRLRLGRIGVVLIGVALAIAFSAFLMTLNGLMADLSKNETVATGITQEQRDFQKWWVVIAVAIAFVGITNAIMMSVTERIKEIGTLKCLGACDMHIVKIFFFETLLLGILGGILGAFLGYALGLFVFRQQFSALDAKVFANVSYLKQFVNVPICVGISAAVAFVASAIPVFFAAKVEPAEAMRYEV